MARTAKSTKRKTTASTKKVANKPKTAARGKAPAAKSPRQTKLSGAPKPATSAAVVKAPKLSVAELRAQLEKLERTNAALRTKNREAGRAAKTTTARISELEEQVTGLEKKLAKTAAPAKSKPAPAGRAKRKSPDVDPGDAVPPSVAVEEPGPLEDEAETAREN